MAPLTASVTDEKDRLRSFDFKHVPALDGVRGIAIIVVMIYHLEFLVPELHPYVIGGFLGVDIFFVLSGFLITSILLNEFNRTSTISLKNFYIRRSLRLVPALWLFVICLYLFGGYLLSGSEASLIYGRYDFVYALTYTMNWFSARNSGLDSNLNHTWSLSIEEQFYILWSIMLYTVFWLKLKHKQILSLTIGLVVVLCISRASRGLLGLDMRTLYYSTDTRIDSLLIGCAASMVFVWRMTSENAVKTLGFRFLSLLSIAAALAVILGTSHDDLDLYVAGLPIFNLSVAVLLFWLVSSRGTIVHKLLENRLLIWIGNISYALYLWHYLMYEFAKKEFTAPGVQVFVGGALAVAVAAASYYLVEKPFLRLKFRFNSIPAKY